MQIGKIYFTNTSIADHIPSTKKDPAFIIKSSKKNERKILKAFLLRYLHELFLEQFQNKMQCLQNNYSVECYTVDSKIIQLLIQDIIQTGEYTLEGIAFHTRIPFDIIYDAACGISDHFSITPWVRIVELYMQVKPDITKALTARLIETNNKNAMEFSTLLFET